MPFIHDDALDACLDYIGDNCENLYICNAEPSTFAEASDTPGSSGYRLGTKASPTISAAENGDASGRKRTVTAISDGTVDYTGTASHWALCDNSLSKLLAAGALSGSQSVTASNTFTLMAFDIELPDPS